MRLSSISNSDAPPLLVEEPTGSEAGLAPTDPAVCRSATASPPPDELPPKGFPWAFVLALLILLGVDVGLRFINPKRVIAYEPGVQEYHAVRTYIDTLGPAEVAFVGSSQTREGILAGEVRRIIESSGAGSVEVANYGVAGMRPDGVDQVVHRITRDRRPRQIILYGVSPRDLRCKARDWPRLAAFWSVSDWYENYDANPQQIGRLLPDVIRKDLSRVSRTLAYRESLRQHLTRWITGQEPWRPYVFGEALTPRHQMKISLDRRRILESALLAYLANDGLNRRGERPSDRIVTDALERLVSRCRGAGVELVFYELPVAEMLLERLPEGLYADYLRKMRRLSRADGVRFVPLKELQLEFDRSEFHDFTHLNQKGAAKLSKAIAEQLLIPRSSR